MVIAWITSNKFILDKNKNKKYLYLKGEKLSFTSKIGSTLGSYEYFGEYLLNQNTDEMMSVINNAYKNPEEISVNLESALKKYSAIKIIYISNAGDINPINKIGEIASQEMVDSLSVNILSPANCINYLLNNYSNIEQLLIINISSGAANKAIKGWSLYSSAKAYMKTYFDVLEAEIKDTNYGRIIVKQIDPGAMDTDMQQVIRNANVPSEQLDRLKNLYENYNLKQPKDVAEMIIQSIRKMS
jgi:benzil reductase ((S)-benzoin forming)